MRRSPPTLLVREAIWRETLQPPQLELQTREWSHVRSSSPGEPHQPTLSGAQMSYPHQVLSKWENHRQKHGCCCFKSLICGWFLMQQQINSMIFSRQNSSFRSALSNSSLFSLSHRLSPVLSNSLFLSLSTAPLSDLFTIHEFSSKISDVVKKALIFDWCLSEDYQV